MPIKHTITKTKWDALNLPMDWSIPTKEARDYIDGSEIITKSGNETMYTISDEVRDYMHNMDLDISAPEGAPDGVHRVSCKGWAGEGTASGAIIENGRFEPKSMALTSYHGPCKAFGDEDPEQIRRNGEQIDHYFIESVAWDEKSHMVLIEVGS